MPTGQIDYVLYWDETYSQDKQGKAYKYWHSKIEVKINNFQKSLKTIPYGVLYKNKFIFLSN